MRCREVGAMCTAIENSKVGDSSTNGRTERPIRDVGGLIRTLRLTSRRRPVVPRSTSAT